MRNSAAQETTLNSAGWRGSQEVWLSAARDALIESGIDAVRVQPMAARLDISRTSFYWFFKDRAALLDALLDEWETQTTVAFAEACNAYAETISEAVLNLISLFHDEARFESQFDFAIRGWAHKSRSVAKRVHSADEKRLDVISNMFLRFDFDEGEADVRARTMYLTQIGYISLQLKEADEVRMARVADYVKTFSGHSPTEGEIARFHARLNYQVHTGQDKS